MNARLTMELIRRYTYCPACGSDKLSNGAGTLLVDDDTFERTCACGWFVCTDAEGKEVPGQAPRLKSVTLVKEGGVRATATRRVKFREENHDRQ